jgi:histidyl-tRNA synthetase
MVASLYHSVFESVIGGSTVSQGLRYAALTMCADESKATRFQAPRGTNDVLPEDERYWRFLRDAGERVAGLFGYRRIETPMFEDARIWLRTNEGTDIVDKEMYVFEDRGGDVLALRPETTAAVCRAYIEHGMQAQPQPIRLFYFAQKFRYDRPQAGRYRQHSEFGVEAIGDGSALVDAEVIDVLASFYEALGLRGLTLKLNSIGDAACRPQYLEALRAYYLPHLDQVCADCRARYAKNPMRLLDCKQPQCQPFIAKAPTITDHLCADCAAHFAELRTHLDALEIAYELDARLVRGLDYYTRTVFEFHPPREGAQSAIGAGGRYDGLIELLGGKPAPGIGFGSGVERIIINLKRENISVPEVEPPRVYIAHTSEAVRVAALGLARRLHRRGIGAVLGGAGRSLKAQLRHADALDARYAAIIGDQELGRGEVTLKDLRGGEQRAVADADVEGEVEKA